MAACDRNHSLTWHRTGTRWTAQLNDWRLEVEHRHPMDYNQRVTLTARKDWTTYVLYDQPHTPLTGSNMTNQLLREAEALLTAAIL